jgi:hypothetical protein
MVSKTQEVLFKAKVRRLDPEITTKYEEVYDDGL